ncbi:MAG: hypothetical protein ACRDIC_19670 [bacterium]
MIRAIPNAGRDVAEYIAYRTDCPMPDPAWYVGFEDGKGLIGGLIFYGPEGDAVHVGWAFEPGTLTLGLIVYVRWCVLWTAFVGLGYDHLIADVRKDDTRAIRLVQKMKFKLSSVKGDRYEYRLEG